MLEPDRSWRRSDNLIVGESSQMLSTGVLALVTLTQGTRELAAWGGADKYVTPSSRRLPLQSTKSPQWERKLDPMRG
jgi:hypothetical protein